MKKIFLVVSPHPDDAELGIGGTILKLKQAGHAVTIVDLTSGEPTPYGTEAKRKREAREAIFNKRYEAEAKKFLDEIRKQAMIEYR